MNSNELIEYLRDPSSLSTESLEELETVINQAPYFQSARMLLAKGSQLLKEPTTKKRIASAAIYATDRPLLKKYISGKLFFLTKPPEKKAAPPSSKGKSTAPSRKAAPPNRRRQNAPILPPDEKLREDELTVLGIPSGALDVILEELEQDMEDLKTSRSKFADIQQKIEDEDAVSEALEHASALKEEFQKEFEEEEKIKKEVVDQEVLPEETETFQPEETTVSEVEPEPEPEKSEQEKEQLIASVINDIEEEVVQEQEQEKAQTEKKTETAPVSSKDEVKSVKEEIDPEKGKDALPSRAMSGAGSISTGLSNTSEEDLKRLEAQMWGDDSTSQPSQPTDTDHSEEKKSPKTNEEVNTASTQQVKSEKKTPVVKKNPPKEFPPSGDAEQVENKTTSEKKEDGDGKVVRNKVEQKKIIDKFIKENPSIPKLEEPLTSEKDLSDTSGEWNKELASETLAEIHLNQGNKKRAIEIYETLSLKFPGKKSYFADLISKIK
ncbi:MAG: hypothetical protein AAGA66_06300 [Bacteroidota bacterium]